MWYIDIWYLCRKWMALFPIGYIKNSIFHLGILALMFSYMKHKVFFIFVLNLFQFLQIWRWQIPTEYVEFSTVFVTWQTLILSQIIWVSLLPQRSWGETSLHFHRVYKYLMSKFWTHKWVNIHAMPEKFESIEIITRNTKTYINC